MIYYFTMMCISKKNVIEKVKNLTKTMKSDFTFESAVDSFINETFGDPLGNVNPDGVDYLLMDLSHDIEDIRKFFNVTSVSGYSINRFVPKSLSFGVCIVAENKY